MSMLELHTNEELIEELLGRDMFVGFVIQSQKEAREETSRHGQFDLTLSKTLNMPQALTLMEICAQELRKKGYKGVEDGLSA